MATNPAYPSLTLSRPEMAHLANEATRDLAVAADLVAIAYAESNGISNAYRPAGSNPDGGNDHGLLQINDKWHPEVPVHESYHPRLAFRHALRIADGGEDFTPWTVWKRGGLDKDTARRAVMNPVDPGPRMTELNRWYLAKHPGTAILGGGLGDLPLPNAGSEILGTVGDAASAVANAAKAPLAVLATIADRITDLIGTLMSPEWWLRIGIGVLGAAMILGGVLLAGKF